jgi:signal transduction histidine kinase
MGIGLCLSKDFRKNNGKIWVESEEEGKDRLFYFSYQQTLFSSENIEVKVQYSKTVWF